MADEVAKKVTFALTSCGRFDLLYKTIDTFQRFNTYPINRFLIIEDSGNEAVQEVCKQFDLDIEIIVNPRQIGLMASLDLLYQQIDTELVFHCEDDWKFFRSGFIEESIQLLEENRTISMVSCRGIGPNSVVNMCFDLAPRRSSGSLRYRYPSPVRNNWGGYSFNPGLRRLSDARALGRFADFDKESDISAWFVSRGFRTAFLERPACETTAFGNSANKYVPRGAWRNVSDTLSLQRVLLAYRIRQIMRSTRLSD